MANIQINSNVQRKQYIVTNPTQSVFPVTFPFLANTDVDVYLGETLMVEGAGAGQYALTGAGAATGGTVTFVTAAVVDDIVTIEGALEVDRTSIYSPVISNLTGDDLNNDFNRDVLMIKQQQTTQDYLQLQYPPYTEISQDVTVTKDRWLPILPAGNGWVMNAENDEIIAAPFGGGSGSGNSMVYTVTQVAHGFTADQVVYFDGANYVLALSATSAAAEVIGMVASITDANTFILIVGGQVTTTVLVLVPGSVYFLDSVTPGLLTTTEPTTTGHISKPLLIATAVDGGVFFNFRGKIISPTTFPWNAVAAATNMVPNENYYTTAGAVIALTLPVTYAVGSIIRIKGFGSLGWIIMQNAGQIIHFGNVTTTLGPGGSIESQDANDDMTLLCVVANTIFSVLGSPIGNFTIT